MPIPKELQDNALWCCWQYEQKNGRMTKIPKNPRNLHNAESNNKSTFGTFSEASEMWKHNMCDGIGIHISNGFCAIDIDHCIVDGMLSDTAVDICNIMESYSEKSPSGEGMRVIFKTSNFEFNKEKYYIKNPKNGVEIYADGVTNRFVTITGNSVYNYPIIEDDEALQIILDKYMVRPTSKYKKSDQNSHICTPINLSEQEILNKALTTQSFNSLFNGNMSAYNNDRSSADLALCNMLAFWTGKDPQKMDNIFRQSALMRDKWLREDYRNATINKAIYACSEVYNPAEFVKQNVLPEQTVFDKLNTPALNTQNWILTEKGISYIPKNEELPVCVTPTPVAPAAYYTNINGGGSKVELHYLYNNRQQKIVVDKETTLNKTKVIKLANNDINITSSMAGKLTQYFSDMERYNNGTIPIYSSSSQLGWHNEVFIPYAKDIFYDGEETDSNIFDSVKQQGKLTEWKNLMHKYRKNIPLRIAMAVSFSSPLIELCGCLPYWLHIWGETGSGKTVALRAAMSIWGDSKIGTGLVKTLNCTENALINTCSILKNLPLAGDELEMLVRNDKYSTFDDLIMKLTEGVERGRMKFNQSLKTRSWRCAFLTTGERQITSDTNGGGTKNRVIEVEFLSDFSVKQCREICNFIDNNYGTAGLKFIEYIQQNFKNIKPMYEEILSNINLNTTGKQLSSAALVLLADKIACDCIFTDETPLTVTDLEPYIKSNDEIDVSVRAYKWVREWLAKNDNKFCDSNCYGEVWGRKADEVSVYVIASVLKSAMEKEHFSFDAIKKQWADRRWIDKWGGAYTSPTTINRQKVHCVRIFTTPDV